MIKRLIEMNLLKGKTATISMMDMRKQPGDVISQTQMGKTFIITKSGKPVAVLMPIEATALELGAEIRRLGLTGDKL